MVLLVVVLLLMRRHCLVAVVAVAAVPLGTPSDFVPPSWLGAQLVVVREWPDVGKGGEGEVGVWQGSCVLTVCCSTAASIWSCCSSSFHSGSGIGCCSTGGLALGSADAAPPWCGKGDGDGDGCARLTGSRRPRETNSVKETSKLRSTVAGLGAGTPAGDGRLSMRARARRAIWAFVQGPASVCVRLSGGGGLWRSDGMLTLSQRMHHCHVAQRVGCHTGVKLCKVCVLGGAAHARCGSPSTLPPRSSWVLDRPCRLCRWCW